MKRILLFTFLFASFVAGSQPFNNEWIDYSKTYYKFKVGANGVYRINQSALPAAISSANAQDFQLWRNGQQVPLYTSRQSGSFLAGDFIEFWGEMNDGKPDNIMYRNPEFQLNDKWSLQTDTAAYFLTINTASANLRLVPTNNDVAGNILPAEPFFMYTAGNYWKNRIGFGFAVSVGENVYSSSYDEGEGWASPDIGKNATLTTVLNNLYTYTGPGAPTDANFKIHASGYNPLNIRTMRVKLNGDSIIGQPMISNYQHKVNKTIPVSLISSGTASIEITNLCDVVGSDRMLAAMLEIHYPRQYNFGGASNFSFSLPANAGGNYIEISNFNYGGEAPVLFDLTNGRRYVGDISNPALVKFALLPTSQEQKLVLVSQQPSNLTTVANFQQRNFINYGLAANQGNYLIITHPLLLNGSNGSQPVNDYVAYRSSAAGGGYNVKVYMIDELVDQFGLGIKFHPLSVRNFIRWTRATYTNPVKSVFLIGKGLQYMQFRNNESNPDINKLAFVPTFGQPASDILLAAEPGTNMIPQTPIGRLSVITADEIPPYLQKVKEYEQQQAFQSPLIADKAWMKNVGHVVGASDEGLSTTLVESMNKFSKIIKDTFYGGNVHLFSKTSAESVEQVNSVRLQNLFNDGMGLLTYFGHSSASTLDFNLDNPQNYNNSGKYPLFILLGCNAGNFFNFSYPRLNLKETISEKFVLAENKGCIATIASSSLGIVYYLDIYNSKMYSSLGVARYGETLGEVMKEGIAGVFNQTTQNDYYARFHCEQASLHGDPALKINSFSKPDYVIEDQLITVSPDFISVAEPDFKVNAKFLNIGKAVNKDIVIELKRTFPDNTTQIIQRDTVSSVKYIDSLIYTLPIVGSRDKGLNKITITLDVDNSVDELYESNNSITKDFYIYEDEARPVYPYNFSIVNNQDVKFYISTAEPFSSPRQYIMEMDTTEAFNSPLKVTRTVTKSGGVFEIDPGITFIDNTVYYWRTAPVPASGSPVWNLSSFIYLSNSQPGFNQSHYFQHTKSDKQRILIDPVQRNWKYDSLPHSLFANNAVFGTASSQEADFTVSPDGVPYIRSACVGFSLIFNIFDPQKFKPRENPTGEYGSALPCADSRLWNYEYTYMNRASRKLAMDFMDSIPDGYIVVVRNILNNGQVGGFINQWQDDTTAFGSGNSLYHKLKAVGFNVLDSFTSPRALIFMYQKGRPLFGAVEAVSTGIYDVITLNKNLKTIDTLGYITSPVFGRAEAWHNLKWSGTSDPDILPGDLPTIDIVGISNNGTETIVVPGLDVSQQNLDISGIDASVYPYLKLRMRNSDSINATPYQLHYWRLTYDPVPEGAIAPNEYYTGKDTVDVGEPLSYGIAFKNISETAFSDSMRVVFTIRNHKTNVLTNFPFERRKDLQPGDTIKIDVPIDTRLFQGHNTVFFNFNPELELPEQYQFNNFGFKGLYVRPDSLNPLMDVTFDGVHILNRDIVSSKPDILIKLKDEAKWMILDDPSLVTVKVKYPDGNIRTFTANNDTLQFLAAGQAPNTDNTASINFKPFFETDGEYELIVTGKDKSDNTAGNIEYRVIFQVINKPMISNMLNYPNPFTTSTAFVFTITGSEVPQNIRIQVMTITGKIVREITKDELGPLRIGRNITDFKWDGTDQYGQKLANGIYLYRVITNLNGKSLDKYRSEGEDTDKYFNKGYGKMYLMR
jgi:hypothetical protein